MLDTKRCTRCGEYKPVTAGQEVRHKNGDRKDARAANLQYGTRTANILDAVAHGTWMSPARIAHSYRLNLYRDGLLKPCRK
jgi:hypothetical protein